jgi:hypothetical protein
MKTSATNRILGTMLAFCLCLASIPRATGQEKMAEGITTLPDETVQKAKEDPELNELLELRIGLDTMVHDYRTRALTKGVKAHERAVRGLSSTVKKIESLEKDLNKEAEKLLKPLESDLTKRKEEEEKALGKLEKAQDRGKDDKIEEAGKEVDALRDEVEKLSDRVELVRQIGLPTTQAVPPEIMLLEEFMKPNEQERKSLRKFVKDQSSLVDGRLLILHLQADLQLAQEGNEKTPADPEKAKNIERQLRGIQRKFSKYFLDVWEPIAADERELVEERDELDEKVRDMGEKSSARRYREELGVLDNKLQAMRRENALYRKLVEGTLAGEKLAELEAKADDEAKEK